jgi:DNA-binding NarL/FixJ family response regulator
MSKTRVIVVDDHAILREGVKALLATYDDIEVVGEAADGAEAIEVVGKGDVDVVLMDIAMPRMDGLEATRRIRRRSPNTKVLILTQYDDKEYILSSVKAGASGCVPKKMAASELVSAIRAVRQGDSFLHPAAVKVLIGEYLERAGEDPYDRLTSREREVLKLVAEGHTNKEIADLLVVSIKTVLGHRTKIMEKLDIHNRTELIKYAIRKGLTSVDV